jgi:hypothetical protein
VTVQTEPTRPARVRLWLMVAAVLQEDHAALATLAGDGPDWSFALVAAREVAELMRTNAVATGLGPDQAVEQVRRTLRELAAKPGPDPR